MRPHNLNSFSSPRKASVHLPCDLELCSHAATSALLNAKQDLIIQLKNLTRSEAEQSLFICETPTSPSRKATKHDNDFTAHPTTPTYQQGSPALRGSQVK